MALTKAHSRMIAGTAINAADFGTVGDGVADDYAALQAAIDAVPTNGTLYIPFGGYRITSGLVRTTPIRITGDGFEIIPDIDASTDAVTLGDASASQYNYSFTGGQIVTSSGTANKCRHGLHLLRTQAVDVDVRVLCAAAEYGMKVSGVVWGTFKYNCGYTNTSFTSGYVRPPNGLWVHYDGVNQANDCVYDVVIELCSNKGLYIDGQLNGGQSSYRGTIAYCGGNPLEVYDVNGANFSDIYFETNTGSIIFNNVNFSRLQNWKRGQAVTSALQMVNCESLFIEGGQHRGDTWTIDADCRNILIDNIDLQGGGITDNGVNTRYGAGVRNSNLANTPAYAPYGADVVNYASNSNFERWQADRPSGGWSKPAAVTYTKTGVGLADTTHRVNKYAAKLEASGVTSATFTPEIKTELIDHIKRSGYVSVKINALFPNTAQNVASTAAFQFRTRIVSTAAGNTDYFGQVNKSILDEWQVLYSGGIVVPDDITDIQFSLFLGDSVQNPTTIYIADFMINPGPVAPREYQPEISNTTGVSVANRLIISDGITSPTTETSFAQIYVDAADGDLKVKFGDGTVKTIVTDT